MGENRIPDDIFKRAIEKACEIEIATFEKKCKDTDVHTFSEKYLEKMQILKMGECEVNDSKIASYSVKKKSTKVKILLIAAIVMLLGAMSVIAIESLKENGYKLVEDIFRDHTYIYFEENEAWLKANNIEADLADYPTKLEKVPKGYQLNFIEDCYIMYGFHEYTQYFVNEDNKALIYNQYLLDELDSTTLMVTSDGTPAEEIQICKDQGYLITDEMGFNIILYPREGFLYKVGAYENVDILVECLESIFEEKGTEKSIEQREDYPRKLEKIPEGYSISKEEDYFEDYGICHIKQTFSHKRKTILKYEQMWIDESDIQGVMMTLDRMEVEMITFRGEEAYLLTSTTNYNDIIYLKDGFLYKIGAFEEVDVLLDCLESIFEE